MNAFRQLGPRLYRQGASPPHINQSSIFPILDPATKIEEERMPAYEQSLFYPVKLGDVFCAKYQIISKLGFGANATIWFCRDLQSHRYVAMKVYIHSSETSREVQALKHLSSLKTDHPGSALVRTMIENCVIPGPRGNHQCIIYQPLLTSLLHFQATLNPTSLPEDLLKGALQQLLLALDYLHSEAHVIHTDLCLFNICTKDSSIFRQWEIDENTDPSPRKIDGNRVVYQSRLFRRKKGWTGFGMPILSDLGEARIGDVHDGLIQPDIYRAPEVVLGMQWDSKVDIWNVGALIWDLFEDHHLFDGRGPDGKHSNAQLLAEMMAMIGPPPLSFLRRRDQSCRYWDHSGNWKGPVEVPDLTLEDSEEYLEGENMETFLRFMQKMLRWDPRDRQSARELLTDPWLTKP
ncbi:kinase-like protein [Xylona heveae TC161]|uniref:Kinase-like protein n=1 Tax=Xylona heveae (strain CBS 132557 / TC161) TaxID=1328760 RepID=A0A165JI71_XYLHT|nr:kinase-like protein [Xylona heveae TC161]KZF26273.1 kinase-like protein [Xylona heveae TC161]